MASNKLVELIKTKFARLDGKQRVNVIRAVIVVGGGLLLLGVYYGIARDKKPVLVKEKPAASIELGDERLEDDIRAQVEKEREEQQNKNKDQDAKLSKAMEEVDLLRKQIGAMEGVAGSLPEGLPSDTPEAEETTAQKAVREASKKRGVPPPNDPINWAMNQGPSGQALQAAEPTVEFVGGIGSIAQPVQSAPAEPEQKKSGRKFFLPVSYMPAKVLTGLRAKTVDAAAKDPEQILLRVQAPAVLPNEVRAALEGCFVVAHGYGSLASERVETRLVTLSCVDYGGRSVIEAPLTGIVLDKDGVKGLAAHPVTKMGANMGRMFLAATVQGAANAFKQQATTTSVSPLGQTQTIDTDQIGRTAAGAGISSGANELVKIYADLVRQSAPVLEMGPGKDAFIYLTQGVWLEVKEYEA